MVMNRSLQEVNVQNMNVELVAQMFKNYQSNVLFHLEGGLPLHVPCRASFLTISSYPKSEGTYVITMEALLEPCSIEA